MTLAACGTCEEPPTPVDEEPTVRPLAAGVLRGVCYAHAYQQGGVRGYGSDVSRREMTRLGEHHVDTLSITPFGFMRSLQAHAIRHADDVGAGETDARVRAELRAAEATGLSVMLKPHLWIRGGAWRARLAPDAGWGPFFESYTAWMLRYARLAEAHAVPWLVIGTELRSSLSEEARWRALIAAIREVYSGVLVYAANWDALDDVPFWDALDAIGVQFYPPLADASEAPRAAVRARLVEHLDALGALSERHDRPVIFTEVGYRSVATAMVRPHEWTEHSPDARADTATQRVAYEVFFGGLQGRPWVRGVFLWKWFTDPESREEGPTGFSPAGKPAADVMRAAYAPP